MRVVDVEILSSTYRRTVEPAVSGMDESTTQKILIELLRLVFGRALSHWPELLFPDEPISGMDPVNARRVKDTIRGLRAQRRTIFLTTHDMATASPHWRFPAEHKLSRRRFSDQVGRLLGGEVTETETSSRTARAGLQMLTGGLVTDDRWLSAFTAVAEAGEIR
ncbi:hypothetical protein [Allokutzneria sp. NRRL B-24872]|uniref:hypothetical protein n=1 Tax=Allokutzneria sp. NRRL B-24872 TaxID=1137961 RepID=UPI001AEFA7E9|nr:hypothetical protein [Allokutzneria sp. NRRL B-24872]